MNKLHPVSLLKRIMPQDKKPAQDIVVGDRFEQRDARVSLWVVERISEVSASPFPLVSLARVGHPGITKTVSLSVLSEANDYRLAI